MLSGSGRAWGRKEEREERKGVEERGGKEGSRGKRREGRE